MLTPVLFFAFLGGVLPTLLWLFFWLMEDRCEPEPKRYIFFCFVVGGLMIIPAYIIEKAAMQYFMGPQLLFTWALTEELLKFLAAYIIALRSHVFDEPLDAVIYMVTAALGFSAFENTLFLLDPLSHGQVFTALMTENLRFIGATLLHVLSSATIGIALAFTFFEANPVRKMALFAGVILAVGLHTLFNFFILGGGGVGTFWIFLAIWLGIVALLLSIERIKQPARDYC